MRKDFKRLYDELPKEFQWQIDYINNLTGSCNYSKSSPFSKLSEERKDAIYSCYIKAKEQNVGWWSVQCCLDKIDY